MGQRTINSHLSNRKQLSDWLATSVLDDLKSGINTATMHRYDMPTTATAAATDVGKTMCYFIYPSC